MNFDIKKFSKTQLGIWIWLMASILWIISFFFFWNSSIETEFNSAVEEWNINNQKGENNTIINEVNGWKVEVAEKIENYYKDTPSPEYLNVRNDLTKTLFWEDLIRGYFEIGNMWKYRDACSLLKNNKCNSSIWSDLNNFSRFWDKIDGWYKVIDIYRSDKQPDNWEIVYCVKYEYKLKQDLNPLPIQEIFQYRLKKREDWLEEISSRVCESKKKWDKVLKCPIETKNLYCRK